MSTSVLEALPGKLDIKSHSPNFLFLESCFIFFVFMVFCLSMCLKVVSLSQSALGLSVIVALPCHTHSFLADLSLNRDTDCDHIAYTIFTRDQLLFQ